MTTEPSGPAMPKAGDTLDGKYALLRVLGQGGMGIVYEAEHLRLKQRCAIKVLSSQMLAMTEIVERFEREARASAQLRSPHVTRVMDVETTPENVPYIVMEMLHGRDLDGELQDRGRLPHEEAVDYVLQACGAIAEAHSAGIIHRDLKPGNLFLARREEEQIVKVLDFGISKVVGDETSKLTGAGTLIGTALYMSPEQLRSAAKVDARSDIWSLGVILFELLTGETPWSGTAPQVAAAIVTEDPPDIMAKCSLPAPLAGAIRKMLRRDPNERFQTIAEVCAAIAPFAPPTSIGRTIAEQIARRAGTKQSVHLQPGSNPEIHTDQMAPTVAREVTNVGVTTNAGVPMSSGPRVALLVIGGLALVAVLAGVGIAVLKPKEIAAAASAGQASAQPPPAASSVEPTPPTPATTTPPVVSATPTPTAEPTTKPAATVVPHPTPHASVTVRPKPSADQTRPKPPPTVNPVFLP
jgi:serine/threonine-protein kinase